SNLRFNHNETLSILRRRHIMWPPQHEAISEIVQTFKTRHAVHQQDTIGALIIMSKCRSR
ncbi:hypothetical protein L9F63_024311, partial [Diploptera punctata]